MKAEENKEQETPKLSELWWDRGRIPGTNEFTTHERWKRVYDELLSLEAKIKVLNMFINVGMIDRTMSDNWKGKYEEIYHSLGVQHGLIDPQQKL
jgi:hypothetical protein